MEVSIPEFYKGRDIFITGGTGFMGKVLIEKLLRSCPDVNKIYILIRNKKNKTAEERLKDVINVPLFDIVRKDNPSQLNKIEPINGDVTLLKLGISENDMKKLENVSIIFHSAASVRFDDGLRDAVIMNTRGTLELLKIAENFKKIECFLHVSTTYCYPERHVVEETLYPPYADWKTTIKIAEKFDNATLNILMEKYSKYQPNTYTFTKSLAEQVVNDFKDKIPVVIYRPSIVVSTLAEPFPGWIDNFNGPVAMMVACGLGIYRTMYGDPDVISDFTPVDVAIKGLIAAAYQRSLLEPGTGKLKIYNCSTSSIKPVTIGGMIQTAKELVWETPLENAVWIPGGSITRCRVWNYIRFMFFHILAAIAIDIALRIAKHKPFLVKLQRRIYAANLALYYFATTHWTFVNNNFLQLGEILEKQGCSDFEFIKDKDICIRTFIHNAIWGSKIYLLKETEEGLIRAKKKQQKLAIIDVAVKGIVIVSFIYYSVSFLMRRIVGLW